jgi:hypothetical protein
MLVPASKRHGTSGRNCLFIRLIHSQKLMEYDIATSNIARSNTDAKTVLECAKVMLPRAVRVNERARTYFRRANEAMMDDLLMFANAAMPTETIEANARVSVPSRITSDTKSFLRALKQS